MTRKEQIAAMQKNIKSIDINGLNGRELRLKSNDPSYKREILLIYGHHASIERMYGFAELFADYGNVSLPDMPGFGGMDSFYAIGMKPTLDNYADYLASYIKLKYRNKKVTLVGMSLGFIFLTRMLQKYPELQNKVEFMVSLVGFTHYHDFAFSNRRRLKYIMFSYLGKSRIGTAIFKETALNPVVLKALYARTKNAKPKFENISKQEREDAMDMEIVLWRQEDTRTWLNTARLFLKINLCDIQIPMPVHHAYTDEDQYFDNQIVEQHMQVIYSDYIGHKIPKAGAHAPSVTADRKDAEPFVPLSLRKVLAKKGSKPSRKKAKK